MAEIKKKIELFLSKSFMELRRALPFFSGMYLHLNKRFTNDPSYCMATDGRNMFISFHGFEQNTLKSKDPFNYFYVTVVEEVLHAALLHPSRMNKLIKRDGVDYIDTARLAADMAVLQVMKSDASLKSRSERDEYMVMINKIAEENRIEYEYLTFEQIYEELKKKNVVPRKSLGGMAFRLDDLINVGSEQAKQIEKDVKNILVGLKNLTKNIGKTTADFEEIINSIYPPINLSTLLTKYLEPDDDDYSYLRTKRWGDFILPSLFSETLRHLICVLDSSGSMEEDDVAKFLAVVSGVLRDFDDIEVTVIQTDVEVKDVMVVTNTKDLENFKIKGRGGTDFKQVFEYISKEYPETDIVLFVTDLYTCDWGKPPCDVVWLATEQSDIEVPFGKVIQLSQCAIQ